MEEVYEDKREQLLDDLSLKLINQSESKRKINQVIHFINVSKSLEKIGDYATNIGEETYLLSSVNG